MSDTDKNTIMTISVDGAVPELECLRAEVARLTDHAYLCEQAAKQQHGPCNAQIDNWYARATTAEAHLAELQQALRTIRRYEMFVMLQGYDVRLDEAADGEVVKWSDLDAILKDTNE